MRAHIIRTQQSGFTLLELLVVLSILVAVASIGIAVYPSVDDTQRENLARVEISELAQGIKTFHQDTGFWPGAVDLDEDGDFDEHNAPFDWTILINDTYYNWNVESKTGWRGPYLSRPLDNVELRDGASILLNGFNSGITGDVGPSKIGLQDPFNTPYLLLLINNRSVIVSAGINRLFDELGGNGLSNVYLDEMSFYQNLCENNFTSDDLVVCL